MLYFDLMILRISFIGLVSIVLTGIFFIARKLLTQHIRFIFLLVIVILPLLSYPMLITVKLPPEAPEWLLDIRLPDPEQQLLTPTGIGFLTESLFKTEGPVSAEISTWLTEHGYQTDQGWSERIVRFLPLLQLIYWFGFSLSLIVNIILTNRRLRKRSQYRSLNASSLNRADWQAELAKIRDEMGIYRKSDIVLAAPDEDQVWAILQNWRQRTIPVPAGEPSAVNLTDRREWLIRQLRLNARPRIFYTIVWLIARSLFWFNPWIDYCYKSLITDDHHRTGFLQKNRIIPYQWIISGVAFLLILGSLAMVGWQIPQQITRDIKQIKIEGASELTVKILDQYPLRTKPNLRWIFDQPKNDYGFALLDAEGKPVWFVPGRQIWDTSYFKDLSWLHIWQTSSVQLPDQSWSLLANISRYKQNSSDEQSYVSDSVWHLHISHDGQLINAGKVIEYQTAQMVSDSIVASGALLNDGSYLLTDRRSQSESLSSDINITLEYVNEITRYDADGNRPGDIASDNWFNTFKRCYINKATRYGQMEFIAQNEIEQFIPIRDHFIGLLNVRGTISLIPVLSPKKQIQTDMTYQAQYRFICLDSNGFEIWQKDLTEPSDGLMIHNPNLTDGDMLYWQASRFADYYSDVQSYSMAYAPFDTIIALNTENASSWKLSMDEKITRNFNIAQWIAQNDCLSLLLTGKNEDPNTLMICQLDKQGELIGLAQLDNIEDYYLYSIVEARPGSVSLYKNIGEG